ncbi:hypothetical protein D1953_20975 [Peribacillus asahii]|uniref:Uncharacterized protein n=1 Tax=Peribacillus asahii TaxID=228899 RepID=A0A398B054_9BACI|nr:hypothetical protein [Peribacillus asahii]RID81380.1 hypothetical protein D1953_20975 [Peribacillus asahii]
MRHVTAAIYISFGFLFYFLQGFDGFIGPDFMEWIIFLFIFVGVMYLFIDLRNFIKKKVQ